jgi:hypothetical protein
VLNGIRFLTAFLSGAKIRLLLSILLKPTALTCVVRGIRAPIVLAQVALLLKASLLWHTDRTLRTGTLLTFLAPVRRLLGRFRFAFLVGTNALNHLQGSEKRAHVHQSHTFFVKVVLVLPLDGAHMQHMSP